MTTDPRFPVGKFKTPDSYSTATRATSIAAIAALPANLRRAVAGLSDTQLDTPYRDGGWTVRQVVHHVADSHSNAFTRLKLALTEDKPTIKPYDEKAWAELPDTKTGPVDTSLGIIDGLHARWTRLLQSLRPADFDRVWVHPEHGERSVDWLLALYAWHSAHHTAHINELRKHKGW